MQIATALVALTAKRSDLTACDDGSPARNRSKSE
jgi:hypothetical protein